MRDGTGMTTNWMSSIGLFSHQGLIHCIQNIVTVKDAAIVPLIFRPHDADAVVLHR